MSVDYRIGQRMRECEQVLGQNPVTAPFKQGIKCRGVILHVVETKSKVIARRSQSAGHARLNLMQASEAVLCAAVI